MGRRHGHARAGDPVPARCARVRAAHRRAAARRDRARDHHAAELAGQRPQADEAVDPSRSSRASAASSSSSRSRRSYATEQPVTDQQLITILVLLRRRDRRLRRPVDLAAQARAALFYIVASGVIYGFVATLAKVVIKRIQAGDFEWLTLLCLVALIAAVAVGAYFVQTAYSSGPPDLVIAGLTVIDPMVADPHRPHRAATRRRRAPLLGLRRVRDRRRHRGVRASSARAQPPAGPQRQPGARRSSGAATAARSDAHPSTGSIRLTEAVAEGLAGAAGPRQGRRTRRADR